MLARRVRAERDVMPPHNFCLRRQRLYQQQLDETARSLAGLTAKGGAFESNAAQLADALADQSLIDALEEVRIPYVVYGVLRDLERLRKSGALFRAGKDGKPPPLWMVLSTGGKSPDDLPEFAEERDPSPQLGYIRYFDRYINPTNVAA